ncbi:hypothetical protein DCAR_0311941 [Daucus carota subsp. sativus]|uniref:RING-type domain-containing protein n=1 Tax=Daucus carota subsp. sativus TaxID=79200 RepID=A0A161WST9_DAUCS|nr:hypothetical protein DCAR_0311941 [Daucus carota subsp. sativus]
MREWDPPSTLTPPSPSPPPKTSLPMLYYGLVVVAAAALVLAVYNFIIVKWCANQRHRMNVPNSSIGSSVDSSSITNLGRSFKYKKGEGSVCLGYDNQECPVCLSVFEEEEHVKQLPVCKHSFHAPCIDMWLYSHLDCPLCRAPVEPQPQTHHRPSTSGASMTDPVLHA